MVLNDMHDICHIVSDESLTATNCRLKMNGLGVASVDIIIFLQTGQRMQLRLGELCLCKRCGNMRPPAFIHADNGLVAHFVMASA